MHTTTPPSWMIKYIGLKFGDKGRGPDEFDCWGLVRWIYSKEFGIELPDYLSDYSTVSDDDAIEKTVISAMDDTWTRVDFPVPGSVILFNIYGRPVHVGLVCEGDWFLHSPEGDFSRRERWTDRMWRNRVEGFYVHEQFPSHS